MCRLLAWVTPHPVPVAGALGQPEFEGFTALSRQHCDGWGMAWWAASPEAEDTLHHASPPGSPAVERSIECAARDPHFRDVATSTTADAGFMHLRWATPGLPVVPANTHPFVHDRMAFAHNGAIHPQDRLDEIIPAGCASYVGGTTDTERYFIAIAQRLAAGEAVADAVAAVVRRIFRDFSPTSLNATLLAPDALYVICAYDPTRAPALCDSSGGENPSAATDLAFYDLRYRVRPTSVVVASSGFDQPDAGDWQPLDNMSLLRIERGTLNTSTVSLATSPSSHLVNSPAAQLAS